MIFDEQYSCIELAFLLISIPSFTSLPSFSYTAFLVSHVIGNFLFLGHSKGLEPFFEGVKIAFVSE